MRKSLVISFCFILNLLSFIYGQGFKIPDKVALQDEQIQIPGFPSLTAKAWLSCIHSPKLTLQPSETYNKDHCYTWISRDVEHPTIPLPFCDPEGYSILPCNQSGIYIVRIADLISGSINYECFIVYIMTGITITEKSSITECMDENSSVIISGSLQGSGLLNVTTPSSPIMLMYSIDGTTRMSENCQIINGLFTSHIFMIPQIGKEVKSVDPKTYTLKISALWNSSQDCKSNELNINVYRLWIDQFQYSDDNKTAPHDWFVVMNKYITCQAYPSQIIKKTKWSLGRFWGELENNTIDFYESINLKIKEENINGVLSNANFGESNESIVVLEAYDEKGQMYIVTSAELKEYTQATIDPIGSYVTQKRYMTTNNKARVFYLSEDFPSYGIPEKNWFKYWNEVIDSKDYADNEIYELQDFGPEYAFASPNLKLLPNLIYDIIYFDKLKCSSNFNLKGINSFYSVNHHENQHIKFWREWWPTNIYSVVDDEDEDLIPTFWEMNYSGPFNFNYKINDGDVKKNGTGLMALYHHSIIDPDDIEIAKNLNSGSLNIDDLDWSYRPDLPVYDKINCQGKQWK
ncbi:MAG: hypothetical protein ABI851_09910 [Saprospiraceae bacterium]